MIDAALIYLAYFVIVATLAAAWFWLGEKWLERRDIRREAQAIADLVEREAIERDYHNVTRHLRLVERDNVVVHAEARFAARRAVAHYPRGGAA